MMKAFLLLFATSVIFLTVSPFANGDPFKVHQFTLKNGLKVYFTQNKQAPEFYSEIVVRAGSKHEPTDATGLAHYLEHLLFKGTNTLGTSNYEEEKKLNEQVIEAYDKKFASSDPVERAALAKKIDELAVKAAAHVIPGEYDRLLSAFGQKYLNAHTSREETVYKVGLPKNRFEQWAKLEAKRFQNPVFARTFQWELEVVYEEKNRGADNPDWGIWDQIQSSLYPNHPYGRSVIGTTEHLKNPSIRKVQEFFDTYYIPNNISIVISGDLEPEQVEKVITEAFSNWPQKDLPDFKSTQEPPLTSRVFAEIQFVAEPVVALAYRLPAFKTEDVIAMTLVDRLLGNGVAGILDDLNSSQKLKGAGCSLDLSNDYGALYFFSDVQTTQTHEQVEKELLAAVDAIKNGDFSDELLVAAKNEIKKEQMKALEDNRSRVAIIREADLRQIEWQEYLDRQEQLLKIGREEIINTAKKYLGPGFVAVYRKNGTAPRDKVTKPKITPIAGKTAQGPSPVFKELISAEIDKIEPVFFDLNNKELSKDEGAKASYLHSENPLNDLADLSIEFHFGANDSEKLCPLIGTLDFASSGNPDSGGMNASDLNKKFYQLGVSKKFSCSTEKLSIQLSGLEENLEEALKLTHQLLFSAELTDKQFNDYISSILQDREKSLKEAETILSAARTFLISGSDSAYLKSISNGELKNLNFADFPALRDQALGAKRDILYTGKNPLSVVQKMVEAVFPTPEKVTDGKRNSAIRIETPEQPTIYFYNRPDMSQALVNFISAGENYSQQENIEQLKDHLFIQFFSGSMGAVVFQEIREKRALAYSASASYSPASRHGDQKYLSGFAGTQSDKLTETIHVFHDIIHDVPWSEPAFNVAKAALEVSMRTERIGFRSIPSTYQYYKERQLSRDPRAFYLEKLASLKMNEVSKHILSTVSAAAPRIIVVGDKKTINFEPLKSRYKIESLEQKDIFGY